MKIALILPLAALMAFNAAACKTEMDGSEIESQAGPSQSIVEQAPQHRWFTEEQLKSFGASGVAPPSGYIGQIVVENKARVLNATEDSHYETVSNVYGQIKENNGTLYILAAGDTKFAEARLPQKSETLLGPNTFFYRYGEKLFAVTFNYVIGALEGEAVTEVQFDDVTDTFKQFSLE